MPDLERELLEFSNRVLTGEPQLRKKVEAGFHLLYFRHENNGYGGGHNFAIRKAITLGSKYHLVVNPDIWFGPRVIPELKRYMDLHEDVAQMMPKVLYPNGQIQRLANLYYPRIPIYHKFNRASHSSFRLFWIHVTNIIMYFNKWGWWKDSFRKEANRRVEEQIADGGIMEDKPLVARKATLKPTLLQKLKIKS